MNKVMDKVLLLSEMQTVELQLNNKLGAFVLCPSWTGDIIWTERSGDIEFSVKRPPADPRVRLHCHSAHFYNIKSKQSEQESKDFVCEQGTKLFHALNLCLTHDGK